MVNLRLWISPGTCSLAPHAALQESGLDYELLVVDILKPPYGFPEKYRHINPKKRIPILEFDGHVITETTAVMTAISQLAPDKHLFGKTNLEVVRSYEWLNWLSGTVHERGMGAYFSPKWYSDDGAAHEGISKKARAWIDHCFGLIEDRLAKIETIHASGDTFTVADIFLWVVYRWGYLLKIDMEKQYPGWTKIVAKVVERDAVKAAVEKEGIPIIRDDRDPLVDGFHNRAF